MTVTAHPLADQLADRWNELHPEEEEEMTTQTTITGTQKAVGPRKGLTHLEWAAEDLGVSKGHPCGHCKGTGTINDVRPADIARALTGSTAQAGAGVHLGKVTEDPPLSMIIGVSAKLGVPIDRAVDWLKNLHKAEVARRNGH